MVCPQLIGIPYGHLKSCTNGGFMQFVQNSGKFTLIAALGRGPGLPRQEPEIWRVCTFCLLAISATWRSWCAFAEVCRLKSGPFCQIFVCRPQKRPQVSAFATLLSVRVRFSVTQQPLAFSSNNMLTIVF